MRPEARHRVPGGGLGALLALLPTLFGGFGPSGLPLAQGAERAPEPSSVLRNGVPSSTAAIPATPSPAEQLAILNQRLYRNRDHLERNARRITLAESMALALERNPILAKAHAGIEATRWSGVAIRREWSPSLKADNNDPGLVGVQQNRDNTLSVSSPELTLEWTFFDPSRTPRARANQANLDADRFLFDVGARSLMLNVQESYVDLQSLLLLEVEYRQLSAMVDHWLALARARRGASPDVDQLVSQQLALLILRVDTHELVIVAASKLARALSLPPGDLVLPAEPLAQRGQWTLSRQETIEQALRLREEIQRSLATARSYAWTAVATRKGYLPTLSVEGTGSTQTSSNSSDLNSEAMVGMNVRWTFFDGGILAAKATSQRRQQDQALQQAALDRLAVTEEVETSFAAYINSQIVADTAIAQMKSARASFLSATTSFQAGTSDATTLLQVLANARGAVEAYSHALRKHNRSVAELERYSARWPAAAPPLPRQRVAGPGGDFGGGDQMSAPTPAPPGRGP
ncbi:MAG: TolC family protein [Cyanobacteriota bacterium]